MVFNSTDENKELLKKYNEVFNEFMDKIKKINSDDFYYEKNYMNIKLNSDDNLPLNKSLKFHLMTVTMRSLLKKKANFIQKFF